MPVFYFQLLEQFPAPKRHGQIVLDGSGWTINRQCAFPVIVLYYKGIPVARIDYSPEDGETIQWPDEGDCEIGREAFLTALKGVIK